MSLENIKTVYRATVHSSRHGPWYDGKTGIDTRTLNIYTYTHRVPQKHSTSCISNGRSLNNSAHKSPYIHGASRTWARISIHTQSILLACARSLLFVRTPNIYIKGSVRHVGFPFHRTNCLYTHIHTDGHKHSRRMYTQTCTHSEKT